MSEPVSIKAARYDAPIPVIDSGRFRRGSLLLHCDALPDSPFLIRSRNREAMGGDGDDLLTLR
jgi:hypothetical protein